MPHRKLGHQNVVEITGFMKDLRENIKWKLSVRAVNFIKVVVVFSLSVYLCQQVTIIITIIIIIIII